jgi:ABC-type transport system involved in multi-copper enzyme maturation permease subunit
MFATLTLIRRELSAYFFSPIAYVVMAIFLIVTGVMFWRTLGELTASGPRGVEFPMQMMLGLGDLQTLPGMLAFEAFWLVFLITPPLLTMRLFAEERASGTLEMLLTTPLRDWQIVLGKFVACYAFYVLMWLPTLAYLPVLLDMRLAWAPVWTDWSIALVSSLGALALGLVITILPGSYVPRRLALVLVVLGAAGTATAAWVHYNHEYPVFMVFAVGIDPMPVLSCYLGLALAGAMFLALGLFVSSLVRSQLVAALVSLFLGLLFIVAGYVLLLVGGTGMGELDTGSPVYQAVFYFTVPLHFDRNFSRGLVDSRQLVLYGSVALFFLFLTVRSLESRRWR